ncbi:MAG TPA: ADOP family duplicated permease [Acidobacteriaceae bacterium]|nr:ADOP family duplicated permease [Acidobacteriaceae bacterium]
MSWWLRKWATARNLTHRQRAEADLEAEVRACAEMLADEKTAGGLPHAEAKRRALAEMGGVEALKQAVRDDRAGAGIGRLAQDVRFGLRQLRRSPAFTVMALLMIAAGIGITTAMYSIVYAVILKPLPFAHSDRLVAVGVKPWRLASMPTLADWQKGSGAFESIAAYTGWAPRIESTAGVGHANALLVSQSFLGTIGMPLRLGQDFTQSGNEADCFSQAIVTDGYWRRMGGGGALDGRTIRLDYRTYAVIGVLAPSATLEDMDALDGPSILTPIGCDPSNKAASRGDNAFHGIARLKPGVTIAAALAEVARTQKNLADAYPQYYPPASAPMMGALNDFVSGAETRSELLATLAACGMLLLIACANLTNLVLARSTRRRSEFALRTMLGAWPLRLFRQMLTENATLVALGSMLGILLANLLVQWASRNRFLHLPRLNEARVDLPVALLASAASATIAIVLTLLPAARSRRLALAEDLRSSGAGTSSAPHGLRRVGRVLVAAQIALAFVLVAASGWMVSSVVILLRQPLGFDPDHLLFASTDLRGPVRSATADPAITLERLRETMTAMRGVPGVEEVAAANDKPLGGRINRYDFCSDAHPDDCRHVNVNAPDVFLVTPNYFETVSQALLRGRAFNDADDGRNHVAIVNRALAQQEWPRENPIGHRIFTGDLKGWATVVGEVGDVHSYSLDRAPVPNLYLPEEDGPDASMTIFLRTAGDPSLLDETVRRMLRSNPALTVRYVESMPELMAHAIAMRRFVMWVVAAFGLLALGLATLGTYALLAYEVSLREREIGIRLALGSQRSAILALLIRQESRWIVAGLGLGLVGAILTGFWLRAEFYHAGSASPPVLGAALVLLAIAALAAVAIPGRRASLLDPSTTLRRE